MRTRGAAIQGSLAAVALVAAYGTWQREPERASGEAVVIDVGKRDVTKVRYEDGAKWLELTPAEGGGEGAWVAESANPTTKAPERRVRGSEAAEKLLERFAPLRASRALGVLPAPKLKELGLESPKKKLEVTARGTKRTFLVGDPVTGVSDPYVKDAEDGRVYLLLNSLVLDLESPTRLVDRTLHGFQITDYDGVRVTAGGKTRDLVVLSGENPFLSKLASQKTPDKPDELAKNWHDKVWRVAVTEVLGKDEAPEGGPPQSVARLEYTKKGKPVGFLELARVAVKPKGAVTASSPPTPPDVYARSERTAGWVKLVASSDELLKEAEKVAATP